MRRKRRKRMDSVGCLTDPEAAEDPRQIAVISAQRD